MVGVWKGHRCKSFRPMSLSQPKKVIMFYLMNIIFSTMGPSTHLQNWKIYIDFNVWFNRNGWDVVMDFIFDSCTQSQFFSFQMWASKSIQLKLIQLSKMFSLSWLKHKFVEKRFEKPFKLLSECTRIFSRFYSNDFKVRRLHSYFY